MSQPIPKANLNNARKINDFREIITYMKTLELSEYEILPSCIWVNDLAVVNIERLIELIEKFKSKYGEDYIIENKHLINDKYYYLFRNYKEIKQAVRTD